jgi:hypothetical protein
MTVSMPSRTRAGKNSAGGSSRKVVSTSFEPLELSAIRRSEKRMMALNAASTVPRYTARHASRKTMSGITRATPAR